MSRILSIKAALIASVCVCSLSLNIKNAQADEFFGPVQPVSASPYAGWIIRQDTSPDLPVSSLLNDAAMAPSGQSILRGMIKSSLQNNDQLRAGLHDALAEKQAAKTALSSLFPKISFTADIGRTRNITPSGKIYDDVRTGSLNLNWTIFGAGANLANIRSANLASQAAELNYLAEERRTILRSLDVYLQLLANQKLIATLKQTKKRIARIRTSVDHQYKAGFASRTDVAQLDSELAAINSRIEQTQLSRQKFALQWETLTGRKNHSSLKMPSASRLLPNSRQAVLSKALANNLGIASAELYAASAEQSAKASKASFLPSLSLYASMENDFDGTPRYDESEWNAGVRLTVPLIDFASTSQHKQSVERSYAARYRMQDLKKQIKLEVKTNWESLASYKSQGEFIARKLNAQKRVVTGINKEVAAGLRPVSDLLREEITLANAKIEDVQNSINKISTIYRIAIHFPDLSLNDFI